MGLPRPLLRSRSIRVASGFVAAVLLKRRENQSELGPVAQSAEAEDLKSLQCRFESVRAYGPVAQWLELAAHNGLVGGSSPSGSTSLTP